MINHNSNMSNFVIDFLPTLKDEDEVPEDEDSSLSDDDVASQKKKTKITVRDPTFNESFEFHDVFGETVDDFDYGYSYLFKSGRGRNVVSGLDQKIARAINKKKVSHDSNPAVDLGTKDESYEFNMRQLNEDSLKVKERKGRKKKNANDCEEENPSEKLQFSEDITDYEEKMSFHDMNLSRPLLKALTGMGFLTPTAIQAATIPVALLGKDLCACAITGSGKTAAFMLPIMERLLYKPKQSPTTRVLVLTPTRELAVQIHKVSRSLAQHTNITLALATGGLDIKSQEAALRYGPDIVIATPGRLIDHLHNSPNFGLSQIEILVLDEADRMLDEYFAEQMKEVIRLCAATRQTMLFSATMTDEVKDLAAVSLKNPVKIFISQNTEVADNLCQEFIRIRSNREGDREAIVAALVCRTFQDHCIIFLQTKKLAHRLHIVYGLLGVRVGELHGNLSQAQRLDSLKKFADGEIDVLLATDLAARGLDIEGIKTVINFTMPNTIKHYVHRVGRTARAGRHGRSISLVGEQERKMLKDILKKAKGDIKSRVIAPEVIVKYREEIANLESTITDIINEEKTEREMKLSENRLNRAENLIASKSSAAQPQKRVWFQSYQEKRSHEDSQRLANFNRSRGKKINKDQKPTAEDRVTYELSKAQLFAARAAKKAFNPKRLSRSSVTGKTKVKKKKSSFVHELTDTSKNTLNNLRKRTISRDQPSRQKTFNSKKRKTR